jgi:predicted DNA-binding protein
MKDVRITVRFPPDLSRRLKASARRSGQKESGLIREAVERQLAAEDDLATAFERAKALGIIGSVKGAPSDLSTNPKHLNGFGES